MSQILFACTNVIIRGNLCFRRLKEQRRTEQEANIKRKEELKEEHKQKSLEGMKRKQRDEEYGSDEDDVGYFRQEVGHDPDEGNCAMFDRNKVILLS